MSRSGSSYWQLYPSSRGNWEIVRNYRRPWAEPPLISTRNNRPSYDQSSLPVLIASTSRPKSPLTHGKRPPLVETGSDTIFKFDTSEAAVQTDDVHIIDSVPENLIDFETELPLIPVTSCLTKTLEPDSARNTFPLLPIIDEDRGVSDFEYGNTAAAIMNIYEELRHLSEIVTSKFAEEKQPNPKTEPRKERVTVGTSTTCKLRNLSKDMKGNSAILQTLMNQHKLLPSTFSSRPNSLLYIRENLSRSIRDIKNSRLPSQFPMPPQQKYSLKSNIQPPKELTQRTFRNSSPLPPLKSNKSRLKSHTPASKSSGKTRSRKEHKVCNWPAFKSGQLSMFPAVDQLLDEARKILDLPNESPSIVEDNDSDCAAIAKIPDAAETKSSGATTLLKPSALSKSDRKVDTAVFDSEKLKTPRRAKSKLTKQIHQEIIALESKELKRGDVSAPESVKTDVEDEDRNHEAKDVKAVTGMCFIDREIRVVVETGPVSALICPSSYKTSAKPICPFMLDKEDVEAQGSIIQEQNTSNTEQLTNTCSSHSTGCRKSRGVTTAEDDGHPPLVTVKSLDSVKPAMRSTGKIGPFNPENEAVLNLDEINREHLSKMPETKSLSTPCVLDGASGCAMPNVYLDTEISPLQLGDGYLELDAAQNSYLNSLLDVSNQELEEPTLEGR